MASFFPIIIPVFNGTTQPAQPIVGGKCHVYLAGTTTPTTVYLDANGITPAANPLTTNSTGLVIVYGSAGILYKFLVNDSTDTTQLQLIDNMPCSGSSGGWQIGNNSLTDSNNVPYIAFTTTANAVNWLGYTNAATGTNPTWNATGTDTNIGENHVMKGSGVFTVTGFGSFSNTLTVSAGGIAITGNSSIAGSLSLTGGSGTLTTSQGITVSAGGITVTGNSTITGTLGGLTGLTVASGGASITGNSSIAGSLSLTGGSGTLTTSQGITVSAGGITVTGNSTITGTLGGLTGLTVASGGASITGNSTVTGTLGVSSTLNLTGGALNTAPVVTLASASTVNIGAAASNYIIITGTTTITAFDTPAQTGVYRQLKFSGALTLTNNSGIILPNGVNITTTAGDCAEFYYESASVWRCTKYTTNVPILPNPTIVCGFRLSLTTGKPVDNSNVTGGTTLYFLPYGSTPGVISLWNGNNWQLFSVPAGMSIATSGGTSGGVVSNVYCYSNSGTPTLYFSANNPTYSSTYGCYIEGGTPTHTNGLYVGAMLTDGASATCSYLPSSTVTNRFNIGYWNYFNRVDVSGTIQFNAATWTYSTATTWRQTDAGSVNNTLTIVCGIQEDLIEIDVTEAFFSATTNQQATVGIGVNSTTVNSAQINSVGIMGNAGANNSSMPVMAKYKGFPSANNSTQYISLEWLSAANSTTFYGTGATVYDHGITYHWRF